MATYTSLEEARANPADVTALAIDGQGLTELPDWISEFQNLEELYCYDNKLTSFPDSLAEVESLVRIEAQDNEFSEIDVVGKLPNLEILYIGKNNLSSLPDFASAAKMVVLDIARNDFEEPPPPMADMANLMTLVFTGNPFGKVIKKQHVLTRVAKWEKKGLSSKERRKELKAFYESKK